MARYDCDICQGRGEVRLPVRARLSAARMSADIPAIMTEAFRTYGCPECSPKVSLRELGVLYEIAHVDERHQVPEDAIKEQLAHDMAANILRHDLIEFRRAPPIRAQMTWAMTGTLLVAPRKTASNVEDFAKSAAAGVAAEVVEAASHQINNWNSYFGHSEILKRDANRLMSEAMRAVLKKLDAGKSV